MPASLDSQLLKAQIAKAEADTDLALMKAYELKLQLGPKTNHPFQNRVYNFWTAVNKSSVFGAVETLGQWVNESNEDIHIIFNSPGGDVHNGLALYDYIKEVQAQGIAVHTSTVGMAASMGGILLQAGDDRVMGANAYILIHEVSFGTGGTTSQVEDDLKLTRRIQERCLSILAERSSLTLAQIRTKWRKTDWWLDASEALEYGFVDAIR